VLGAAGDRPKDQLGEEPRAGTSRSTGEEQLHSSGVRLARFTGGKAPKEYLGKRLIKSHVSKLFILLLIACQNENGKSKPARAEVTFLGRF